MKHPSRLRAVCTALLLSGALASGALWAQGSGNTSAASPAAKSTAKPAGKAAASKGSAANSALVSCKKQAGKNLIKREKCVWSHCKDRWGKGECPPEAKPKTAN